MPAKDGGAKGGTNDKAEKESPLATDNSESDESELGPVKPKTKGEPSDNLHRRADWFKKRHGGY